MQRIFLAFGCLICVSQGWQVQATSRRSPKKPSAENWQTLNADWLMKDAMSPRRALAGLLMGPTLTAAFNPGIPHAAVRHPFVHRHALAMSESSSEEAQAEMLKLKAEQARLQAEKAKVEAELLEMEVQQLKAKTQSVQAERAKVEAELLELESKSQSAATGAQSEAPAPMSPPSAAAAPVEAPLGTQGQVESIWPEAKLHRFITKDDPSFSVQPGLVRTRENFVGTRKEGAYQGSFRVEFTLPDKQNEPAVLELLQTTKGNPTFGAVQVKVGDLVGSMPPPQLEPVGDSKIDPTFRHSVVTEVNPQKESPFMKGDIIRAVSLPEIAKEEESAQETNSFFGKIGQAVGKIFVGLLPPSEERMVILDGSFFQAFEASLKENMRVNGAPSEVTVIIERPEKAADDDGGSLF